VAAAGFALGDNGGDFSKAAPGADRFFGATATTVDSRDGLAEHDSIAAKEPTAVEADLRDIVEHRLREGSVRAGHLLLGPARRVTVSAELRRPGIGAVNRGPRRC